MLRAHVSSICGSIAAGIGLSLLVGAIAIADPGLGDDPPPTDDGPIGNGVTRCSATSTCPSTIICNSRDLELAYCCPPLGGGTIKVCACHAGTPPAGCIAPG